MDQEVEFRMKISWNLRVNTAILKLRSQNKPLRKWKRFLRALKKCYYFVLRCNLFCLMKCRSKQLSVVIPSEGLRNTVRETCWYMYKCACMSGKWESVIPHYYLFHVSCSPLQTYNTTITSVYIPGHFQGIPLYSQVLWVSLASGDRTLLLFREWFFDTV